MQPHSFPFRDEFGKNLFLARPVTCNGLQEYSEHGSRLDAKLRMNTHPERMPAALYRFDGAEFDARAHELRISGRRVQIEAKALQVLACLVSRPGETLTREELFAAAWPGRVVSEGALAKAVMKLRSVFGANGPQIVRTVHGFGYRLGVPVEVQSGEALANFEPNPGQAVPFRPNWQLKEVLDPLRGGMVWLGEHAKTREKRVFKFAPNAEALAALKREITLYRLLCDSLGPAAPVVRIIDWSLDEPPYFIESEWIDGGDLTDWISGPASQGDRVDLIAQVCEAVATTHALGVLHKDLKPANILVQGGRDAPARIKIADFGIGVLSDRAAIEALGITRLGFTGTRAASASGSGTPLYLAPEVLAGQVPTQKSDIYALGVMLYQTLVRDARRPLAPGWERDIDDALLREDIAAAADVDPDRRLGDARELARRLRGLAERRQEREALARAEQERIDALRRAEIQTRRNRLAATLSVVLLVASLTSFSFYRDARQAQSVAESALIEARREAGRSEAINRFMREDLLEAANPLRRAPGAPEVSVREALDLAETRVSQRFAADPDIATSLYTTLGALRTEFGEYEAAENLYLQARAAAEPLAPDDPLRMRAEANLASLLISMQRNDEAQALLAPLLIRAEARLGAQHPDLLEWRLRWLESLSRQGADQDYGPALEGYAEEVDRALGVPNSLAGQARLLVAHGLRTGGAPEQGAEIAARAHADLSGALGNDHPYTLKAMAAHAHGLMAQGNDQAAIDAMRTAFRLQLGRFGPLHLDSLFLQNELGFMLVATDRHAEAEPVFEDLVGRRAEVWGEVAIQLVPPLSNLAQARMRLGLNDLALADIDRALVILDALADAPLPMRAQINDGNPMLRTLLGDQARLMARQRPPPSPGSEPPSGLP